MAATLTAPGTTAQAADWSVTLRRTFCVASAGCRRDAFTVDKKGRVRRVEHDGVEETTTSWRLSPNVVTKLHTLIAAARLSSFRGDYPAYDSRQVPPESSVDDKTLAISLTVDGRTIHYDADASNPDRLATTAPARLRAVVDSIALLILSEAH